MARKSKNVTKNKILAFFFVLLLFLMGYKFSAYEEIHTKPTNKTVITDGELQIYFLNVGQADSIFITNKGKNMLIDAGNNADGNLIVEFLKENNIEKIDYLIGTHPHEDHIGGLDDVIKEMNVENIFMPKKESNTKTFEDVLDAIKEKGKKIIAPKVGDIFSLGDASFEIMSIENDAEEANESSIVIEMTYGTQKFLFTGDMEVANEEKRSWNDIDVLKVAHHGSNTSSSAEFLYQTLPEIAVISVGKDNSYGHPHHEVLERLNDVQSEVYRTDLDGTILIISNGQKNEIQKLDIVCDGDI